MQYFLYVLIIFFLLINYKIIASDFKSKIIPNKYLLYLFVLIPFYYIYIFFQFPEINYLFFSLQIFLTFIISFILYFFGIWAAGDAKYLLVLSLFIPYIGVTPFIGNIALLTLIYLFIYFIWFYFYKLIFNGNYRKNLWLNIKQDLSEKWRVHKKNKGGNTYKIIFKFLLTFLIIFVSIRLLRIFIFNNLIESQNRIKILTDIIEKYNIYLIFLGISVFIGGLFLFKIFINKIKIYIYEKLKLNLKFIGNILIFILFLILINFIGYEYYLNSKQISNLLFRIFTIYLGLYLIFKILKYSYKITFGITEYQYINIKNLKKGDIIDKEYLVNIFKRHGTLKYIYEKGYKIKGKIKKILIYGNILIFFNNINNPIEKEGITILNNLYKSRNYIFKKNKKNSNFLIEIKTLKTFSFAPYIFFGFILTILIKNLSKKYLLNYFINIVKKIH